MKWICSQIGAREHYAVPRVLHRCGKLETLFTDFWATPSWREMGNLIGKPKLRARYHPDLENASVQGFNFSTLIDMTLGGKRGNPFDWHIAVGNDFCRSIIASLEFRAQGDWTQHIYFGYDTGFLEAARWVKSRGAKSVVCQMDPARFESDLVKEEEQRWPGWAKRSVDVPEAFHQRREQEWVTADVVMVNSEWTKEALIMQGVSSDKIVIVPLAYESSSFDATQRTPVSIFSAARSLRVLFLGQVILRKGIQYLMEAASMLKDEPVRFDVVGPIGISDSACKAAPKNMNFHREISRDQARNYFLDADLFVLPTLSDGFALTQIEAMAYGLPVITTPNCGRVVTDGVDGLVVPPRDSKALAQAILSFVANPNKLNEMSERASKRSGEFGFEKLEEHLRALETRLL